MELDRTRIAIRERGFLEIMDLSLRILRRYPAPLFITWFLGALPFAALNAVLLGRVVDEFDWGSSAARYLWLMIQLVFIEAPAATSLMTLYLGAAMFFENASAGRIWRDWRQSLPALLWLHGLMRGVIPALALTWLIWPQESFSPAEVFLPMLCLYAVAIRAARPFIGEIVLLERNPLSKRAGAMTVARRSAALHGPSTGDLMARWLGSAAIGVLLGVVLVFGFWSLQETFVHQWQWGWFMIYAAAPTALWMLAGFFAVVRFLSYLDIRIRREGWEVELRLRAEATRHAQQMAITQSSAVLVVAFMVAWLAGGSAVVADDALSEAAKQQLADSMPWYDESTGELKPSTAEETEPPPRPKDWKPPKREDDEEDEEKASRRRAAQPVDPAAFLNYVLWSVGSVLLIALIVLIIVAIVRARGKEKRKTPSFEDIAKIEELPFAVRKPKGDFLSEARRLYQEGKYGEAMLYFYSYLLLKLDRRQLIHLDRGKTNRQYLRELRGFRSLRGIVEPSMIAFEEVFFGRHKLTRDRFERCFGKLDEFEQLVEQAA